MDLSLLKPILAAEGQKLVDDVLFPELQSLIESKVSDPFLKGLALSLLPVLKSAADSEIQSLLK